MDHQGESSMDESMSH